jgi:hypothetical protein
VNTKEKLICDTGYWLDILVTMLRDYPQFKVIMTALISLRF